MSGPHEDVEKENRRLRKEVRLLREEMSLDILGVQIANGSKNLDDEQCKLRAITDLIDIFSNELKVAYSGELFIGCF